MKKYCTFFLLLLGCSRMQAQELYVFTEPASNMPANSISVKLTGHFVTNDNIYSRFSQRYMPEIMFGISKKLMIHIFGTAGDMHTNDFKIESGGVYVKYRFLSNDDIHRHFRMAVFADASTTKAPFHYDDISLMGDKSGVEAGLIATQLLGKLAVSATVSHTQVLDKSRTNEVIYIPERSYQSMNYALSAGYLLFPRNYTNFKQTNMNLYTELLAQQTLDRKKHYIDMAPAVQFILNSISKLNIGYRFQLAGNMERTSHDSWLVSYEYTFLNVLKKK
ncbi:MAG: hypothetical protein ABI480_05515 [Chitinophagaceae bacterium]